MAGRPAHSQPHEPELPRGLRGDLARLFSERGTHAGRPSLARALQRAVTRPGPLAIVLYRLSHRIWKAGLRTPAELVWRLNYFLTGADVHPGAEIGGGVRMAHTSGIVIANGVRIGSNVTISPGVGIGGSARRSIDPSAVDGVPTIGDRTRIGIGAKLLGLISVGSDCFIGANVVVARDLPDGTVYTPGRETAELRRRVEQLSNELQELRSRLSSLEAASRDRY